MSDQCLMCSEGQYIPMRVNNSSELHNSGLGLTHIGTTGWRAVECNRCGNVQVFRRVRTDEEMRQG